MITTAQRLAIVEEYYFSSKLREVRQLAAEGKPVINMGIGSPDLKPAPAVIAAMTAAMQDENAHQYQSYQGLPELRQAMADFYERNYQVSLNSTTEILPLMGSKEGIMHISLAFLNEGDGVLIPNPGYPTYTSVTNLVGAVPLYYDLKESTNWEPDFEALEKMEQDKSKIDFDVCLLGCGAYGMPLAAFIKSKLQKTAIHIGGSLQLFFGIKGNRWENPEYGIWATNDIGRYPKLFNEYWIRPYGGSQVKGSEKVDDNCYW